MQEIRHSADAIRYLLHTPAGLLEYRATAAAVGSDLLITHRPDCDGDHCNTDCDADHSIGITIGAEWDEHGEAGVFGALANYAQPAADQGTISI